MPSQWTRHLSTLFDAMPPRPYREVLHTLSTELPRCAAGKLHGEGGR